MTLDIMMPFYGRIDQFIQAVESVLAQSSEDWTLTIVDDVYPDLSAQEWAIAIADPRVRYVRNNANLGVSGNFRRCVELMTQPHAVIMGCDDLMLPGFVARFEELAGLYPDASVYQPGVRVIDDTGTASRPLADRVKDLYRPSGRGPRQLSGESLAASLARGNWAYFPSLIWKVAAVKEIGFRADLEVALDLAMLLELIARGGSLVLDDVAVLEYRRHSGSVSAFTAVDGTRFVEEREVLRAAARRFSALGWTRAERISRHYVSSRLNALSVLPRAFGRTAATERSILLNHIFGRPNHDRAGRSGPA